MGKRFKHEHLFQRRALDLYLKFSVLSGSLIAAMVIATRDGLFGSDFSYWPYALMNYPMTAAFVALNFVVTLETRPYRDSAPIDNKWGAFFLIQFFMVLALGLEHSRLEFFYLSTMPVMAFLFSLQSDWFTSKEVKKKRATLVMGIALFSLGGALYHPDFRGQWPKAAVILLTFGLWQWGTIYLANVEWIRLSRQTLRDRLKKRSPAIDLHPSTSERYFFHDLINHSHGIQLFLKGRQRRGVGLELNEVEAISLEVEAMQNLIHDYFGLNHKNLTGSSNWKSLVELKPLVSSILESFLPPDKVEVFLNYKGVFSSEQLEYLKAEGVMCPELPAVTFHRILTNLVKNCSEAMSQRVELCLEGTSDHLLLTLKNDVFKKRDYGYELGKTLESMISNEAPYSHQELKGLGLESIESLSHAIGGDFHFYIDDGHWVSQVKIPYKEPLSENMAKLPELGGKKAA